MGHMELVEWLLDQGANPRLCDDENHTAFFVAADGGFKDVAELLYQQGGVDVDDRDIYGLTALDWAVEKWASVPTDCGEFKAIEATIEWLLHQGYNSTALDEDNNGSSIDGDGVIGLDKFYNLRIIIPGEGGEEESPSVDYGEEEEQGEEEEEDEEGLEYFEGRSFFSLSAGDPADSFDNVFAVGEASDSDYTSEDGELMPWEGEDGAWQKDEEVWMKEDEEMEHEDEGEEESCSQEDEELMPWEGEHGAGQKDDKGCMEEDEEQEEERVAQRDGMERPETVSPMWMRRWFSIKPAPRPVEQEKFEDIKIGFDLIQRTWINAGFGVPGQGPLPFAGI